MTAFYNDPELKQTLIDDVVALKPAGRPVFREIDADIYNLPADLLAVANVFAACLLPAERKVRAEEFVTAIPVGADLSKVLTQFVIGIVSKHALEQPHTEFPVIVELRKFLEATLSMELADLATAEHWATLYEIAVTRTTDLGHKTFPFSLATNDDGRRTLVKNEVAPGAFDAFMEAWFVRYVAGRDVAKAVDGALSVSNGDKRRALFEELLRLISNAPMGQE